MEAVSAGVQRCTPREGGGRAQLGFDKKQAVVLGYTVRAAQGTGLDLGGGGAHTQVCDRGVFGLTRAVREHRGVAGTVRQLDRVEGLGQRADLVHLHQQRIGEQLVTY